MVDSIYDAQSSSVYVLSVPLVDGGGRWLPFLCPMGAVYSLPRILHPRWGRLQHFYDAAVRTAAAVLSFIERRRFSKK